MNITGIAINADAGFIDGNLAVLDRELAYYKEIGFSHVELSPHGVGAIHCGRLDEGRLKEVQTILAKYSFGYTVHGPNPLNLMNSRLDALDRQAFKASIEFTAAVGASVMVYHAGRYLPEEEFMLTPQPYPSSEEKRRLWEQEKGDLNKLGNIAAQHGVTICVENARPYLNAPKYCYGESLKKLAKMVKQVDHPNVGITLDIGHAYLSSCRYGLDLYGSIDAVAPFVKHVHLHDNFGRCSTSYERKQYEMAAMGRGDMHMPIGWGEVPAQQMLAALPEYHGVITLELRPRYHSNCRDALDAVRQLLTVEERCVS